MKACTCIYKYIFILYWNVKLLIDLMNSYVRMARKVIKCWTVWYAYVFGNEEKFIFAEKSLKVMNFNIT